MDDWLKFLILSLAVFRLSSLLVREDGPKNILARFRHFIGVRYNSLSLPYGKNTFAELFCCTWCMSVWISLIFTAAAFWCAKFHAFILIALAASGLSILVDCAVSGGIKHG